MGWVDGLCGSLCTRCDLPMVGLPESICSPNAVLACLRYYRVRADGSTLAVAITEREAKVCRCKDETIAELTVDRHRSAGSCFFTSRVQTGLLRMHCSKNVRNHETAFNFVEHVRTMERRIDASSNPRINRLPHSHCRSR
jgi:hypothetical protein